MNTRVRRVLIGGLWAATLFAFACGRDGSDEPALHRPESRGAPVRLATEIRLARNPRGDDRAPNHSDLAVAISIDGVRVASWTELTARLTSFIGRHEAASAPHDAPPRFIRIAVDPDVLDADVQAVITLCFAVAASGEGPEWTRSGRITVATSCGEDPAIATFSCRWFPLPWERPGEIICDGLGGPPPPECHVYVLAPDWRKPGNPEVLSVGVDRLAERTAIERNARGGYALTPAAIQALSLVARSPDADGGRVRFFLHPATSFNVTFVALRSANPGWSLQYPEFLACCQRPTASQLLTATRAILERSRAGVPDAPAWTPRVIRGGEFGQRALFASPDCVWADRLHNSEFDGVIDEETQVDVMGVNDQQAGLGASIVRVREGPATGNVGWVPSAILSAPQPR